LVKDVGQLSINKCKRVGNSLTLVGERDVIELMNPETALLLLDGRGCVIYFPLGKPDVVTNTGTAAIVADSLVRSDSDAVTATQTWHSAEI